MALPKLVDESWYLLRTEPEPSGSSPVVVIDLSRMVVVGGSAAGSLKTALREACARPLVGKPRRPRRVGVAGEGDLREIQGVLPGVAAEIAEASPELARMAWAHLRREASMGRTDTLGYGPERFNGMLALAEDLHSVTPWRFLADTEWLTVRSPSLELDDAVLVVLGQAGEQLGFLLFFEREAAVRFAELADRGSDAARQLDPTDPNLFGDYLGFTLDLAGDVPWELVQAANAAGYHHMRYPLPLRASSTRLGVAPPRDLEVLVEVGRILVRFVFAHQEALERGEATLFQYDDVTLLYHGQGAPADARVVALGSEGEEQDHGGDDDDSTAGWRAYDFALLERLANLSDAVLSASWREPIVADAAGDPMVAALELWPTLIGGPLGTSTPIAELRRQRPQVFDARAEAVLAAQSVSWTGLWEVHTILPGQGFGARDLITHEDRFVEEIAASRSLRERAVICARIPTVGEHSWIAATDPRTLSPYEADQVRLAACARFGWPKTKAVPLAKALAIRAQRELGRLWNAHIVAMRERPLPEIRTPEGHQLLIVSDRYAIASPPELSRLVGAEPPAVPGDPWFLRSGGETLMAKSDIYVEGDGLSVESLSLEQADRARALLEEAFGGAGLKHLERATKTMLDAIREQRLGRAPDAPKDEPAVDPELAVLMNDAVMRHKVEHYATWPEIPLPALDGKSPREASRTQRGRLKLERLLADMEHDEQREAPSRRYDFNELRRELGLPPARVHPGTPRH